MAFIFVAAFFYAVSSAAAHFVISEIFSNSVGSGSDHGKEWFELMNTNSATQTIKSLHVDIFTNDTITFSQTVELARPVIFEKTVLIAQEKNLGLGRCLNQVPVVVFKEMSLANSGALKICVGINGDNPSCTTVSKKQKRPDGVALFRDPADAHEEPLFIPEPCLLADNVFATPGFAARACAFQPNFSKLVFGNCNATYHEGATLRTFQATPEKFNLASLTIQTDNNHVNIDATNYHDDNPLLVTQCKALHSSMAICYEQEQHAITKSHPISLNWPSPQIDHTSHIVIRDVRGAANVIHKPNHNAFHRTSERAWRPDVKTAWSENVVTISVSLKDNELPFNLWVIGDDGEILQHLATVEQQASLTISVDEKRPPRFLRYAGIRGQGTLPWPTLEGRKERS